MKSRIILSLKCAALVSVIALASGCNAGTYSKQSDMDKFGLDGQVSKVKVVCDTAFNKIAEDNYEATFDASGNLTMLRALYTDGSTMNYEIYEYDSEGRLDQILLLDKDSTVTGRYSYEYDGRFIGKCTLYGMNNQDSQTWIHSNDGKHIVTTEFYQEGELQAVSKSKWSHKGEVREETVTDVDGELVGLSKYVYLFPNKPLSIKGDLINIVITYGDNGLPQSSTDVFISSKGDLVPIEYDNPDVSVPVFTYEYTFDSLGRWISRKATLDGDIYEILTRTIE